MLKTVLTIAFALILLALLYIANMAARYRAIKRLRYSRSFSQPGVFEGEKIYLTEVIYNNSFYPLPMLDVGAYICSSLALKGYPESKRGDMQHYKSRFHLLPFMQIKRTYELTCKKRGFYGLETAEVYFNKQLRYLKSETALYVYPKLLPLSVIPFSTNISQGGFLSNRWIIEDPFSLSGVREYRRGDPFHSINFKATAKAGQLRVNSRDYCSNRCIMIYLNFQIENGSPESKYYEIMMETGLSYAAAILQSAIDQGSKAGFAANCRLMSGSKFVHFPMKSGYFHLEAIFKEMATIRLGPGFSFGSMLEADALSGLRDTEIYILSSYISESTERKIRLLKQMNNSVNYVCLELDGGSHEDQCEAV